ncbi:MAG: 50S ribosomal protein L23 [Gammaproteobacteria bacterium]|nr:50S ribosomal protein L23 [Gammaproteobacteria bacterium]
MSSANKLKEIEALKVIIGPHMTEKSYSGDESNLYVFRIQKKATKLEVKYAIESFYNVKVKSVKTLNVLGKTKTFKQKSGKRQDWKKAYIQLQEGFKLDFVAAVE